MERSAGTPLGWAILFLFAVAFGWVAIDGATGRDGLTLLSFGADPARQNRAPLSWPDGMPNALATYEGQEVTASGLTVTGVDADEGFWVEKNGKRAWIQLAEPNPLSTARPPESPYTVRVGDVVSLTGRVVPHEANYPSRIYFCTESGPGYRKSFDDVAAARVHLAVEVDELKGVR